MNNFHIYEEVGRGKYSVVYKVSVLLNWLFSGKKEKDDWLRGSKVCWKEPSQEGAKWSPYFSQP